MERAPLVLHPGAHDVVCAGAHHNHDPGGVERLVDGVFVGALAHLGEAQGAAEGLDALFLQLLVEGEGKLCVEGALAVCARVLVADEDLEAAGICCFHGASLPSVASQLH